MKRISLFLLLSNLVIALLAMEPEEPAEPGKRPFKELSEESEHVQQKRKIEEVIETEPMEIEKEFFPEFELEELEKIAATVSRLVEPEITLEKIAEFETAIENVDEAAINALLDNNPSLAKVHFSDGRTPLHKLASVVGEEIYNVETNVRILRQLLQGGADINAVDPNNETALTLAAGWGVEPIVDELLSAGANLDTQSTDDGKTALMRAITENDYEEMEPIAQNATYSIAEKLIDHGANVNLVSHEGLTALMHLLMSWGKTVENKQRVIEKIINRGADVNIADEEGYSALIIAARMDDPNAIAKLLSVKKINLDYQNARGDTALMVAIKSGHKKIAQMLIEAGADVNKINPISEPNMPKFTTLMIATVYDKTGNIIESLITHGALVNGEIGAQHTPLITAIATKNVEGVKKLLKAPDIEVNKKGLEGNTALMFAVMAGNLKIVQLLVEHGADFTRLTNDWGESAYQLAQNWARKEMLEFFDTHLRERYTPAVLKKREITGK